ncbi:MAG: tryptophan halogenase family protein [Pacificimonas sp.]
MTAIRTGQENAIRKIAIIGGGTAGWMAAAALSRMFGGTAVEIELVESDAIGTVGVGEATIPNIAQFNAMLGLDEADFMAKTHGTFKLGIEFVDWGRKGERYLHPFGNHGVDMDGIAFHQYHRAGGGDFGAIQNFSLSALAAKADKFSHPAPNPRNIRSQIGYAYHFDATKYAAYLRAYAENGGVKRIEGKVVSVQQDGESGFVTDVTLESGASVAADLFIDCSGFRALLIGDTLEVDYQDWSRWLPCDSALAVPTESSGSTPPYTRATAHDAGWQWKIPTQKRTGNGNVYASGFTTDEAARDTLIANLDGEMLAEPRQLRFTTGKRTRLWEKNVVALGLSGGFLEPLESTSIYLIQAGISRLLSLFPDRGMSAVDRDEYNRLMDTEFAQIRDFLILHYHATARDDSAFWNHVRTMSVPDSLNRKIELFREGGRFFRYDGDLFTVTSWVAVFLGQGIVPKRYDPIVAAMPPDRVRESLASMRAAMKKAVETMPSHDDYLRKYCPA